MKFLKYIFDLFMVSALNDCNDLFVQAQPMLLSDAKTGVRQYTDVYTDLAALHEDYPVLVEEDQAMREFVGRHYDALVKAFKQRDRAAFDAVVAECVAEDKSAEEAAEEEAEQ